MTTSEKFQSCLESARRIVAAYRSEVPLGFDPVCAEVWVAAAGVVVAAGSAAYQIVQQKKAAAAAKTATANQPGFKPFNPGVMPTFHTLNSGEINKGAVAADVAGFAASDADFNKRHGPIVSAEKLFEAQTLKDQTGDTELSPAIQSEFQRAGLENAMGAFGDTPGTLAPGSAGEAGVARNLGLSIVGFQDRNRVNRAKSLVTAEELFPRREFGLSGDDVAQIDVANNAGENAFNQANYAASVQAGQFNATGEANHDNALRAQGNYNASAAAAGTTQTAASIAAAADAAAKFGGTIRARTAAPSTATPLAQTASTPLLSARPAGWKSAL